MRTNLNQTQKDILQYISDQTKKFQKAAPEIFTANYLAGALNISRNSASQYLNEFAKEGILVKTNSGPVYFLHRETLEEEYHIRMNYSVFAGLSELQEYLRRLSVKKKNSDITGNFLGKQGNDSELLDIDQRNLRVNSDQEQVLYQSLLESYEQVRKGEASFDAMMKKSRETINACFDYMVFEKNYSNEKIRVTEQVLTLQPHAKPRRGQQACAGIMKKISGSFSSIFRENSDRNMAL